MKKFFYLSTLLFVATTYTGCMGIPLAVALPMFAGAAITGAGAAAGAGGVIGLYDETIGRITGSSQPLVQAVPTPVPTPMPNPKNTSPYNEGHDAASPW